MLWWNRELRDELKRKHRYGHRPTNFQLDYMVRMQFPEWFAKRVSNISIDLLVNRLFIILKISISKLCLFMYYRLIGQMNELMT